MRQMDIYQISLRHQSILRIVFQYPGSRVEG